MSNWAKQNPFLTGLIGATAVGAGTLGYLLYSAQAKHDETWSTYEQQSAELNRLEKLQPFPNQQNLTVLEAQRKQHAERIDQLQKNVATLELPLEQITPEKFQDQLRTAVTAFRTKATQSGLKLPDNFFLGFGRYETQPPRPEAAPLLSRELKTIEIVLNQAAEQRVSEIRGLDREELAEERGAGAAKADSAPAATTKPGGKGGGEKGKGGIKKQAFELTIFSEQPAFSNLLNFIVTNKTQFLIPRVVTVKNEKDKGPPRLDPLAGGGGVVAPAAQVLPDLAAIAGGAAPAAQPAASAAPAAAPSKFIVGEERLEVTMLLELVDFAEVPSAAPGKPATAAR